MEKFQRMEPESYEANNLVGRAALGGKEFAKAEQAFRKVLAKKADYCYAMVNLGKTYIAQKRWSESPGNVRKKIQLLSTDSRSLASNCSATETISAPCSRSSSSIFSSSGRASRSSISPGAASRLNNSS